MILYKQFLDEMRIKLSGFDGNQNKKSHTKFLDDLHKTSSPHPFNDKARILHNTTVHVSTHSKGVHVHDILSHESEKGNGTKALNHLTSLADKHNVKLDLHAKAYSKDKKHVTHSTDLSNWYHKHGFRFTDSEHHKSDFHDGVDMEYHPK